MGKDNNFIAEYFLNILKTGESKQPKKKERVCNTDWKNDFSVYKAECEAFFNALHDNAGWIESQKRYYPNVYIRKTLEKMYLQFWGTEAGWLNKKSKKTDSIDWLRTIENNFSRSAVFVPKGEINNELYELKLESNIRELCH